VAQQDNDTQVMTPRDKRPRILAIIQAGGKGSRMDVLTRETPKPALPFAGTFNLIDFPLSNARNSGIEDVWLSVQYLGQQLGDLAANGKPWDLDRHHGGFKLVLPEQGSGSPAEEGFVHGNAEELLQNRDAIRQHQPDAVVVMSADHVYRLNCTDVVEQHLARSAECTIVTTEIDPEDATHHAAIITTKTGKVRRLDYKPDRAHTGVVATEVVVYSPEPLIEVLEDLHRNLSVESNTGAASQLGDFGEHLLPALIRRGHTYAYPLPGYWRDLGRPETYYAAHQELLTTDTGLFSSDWPITTNATHQLPARIESTARVISSLISPGCQIAGTVRRSVLGPGVTVAAGATVVDSILHAEVHVEPDARIHTAIIDAGCTVGSGAALGRSRRSNSSTPALILVGRDCTIAPTHTIAPGARLEPGTTT
jgi:glucose-1-phosphate adenylyltransferase